MLVGRWIWEHIGEGFDATQYGVIKNTSTTRELIDMLHLWYTAVAKGETVRVPLIDFSKAFDLVSHPKVLENLGATGLPHTLLNWQSASSESE